MHFVFFDDTYRDHILPLVYTKPVSELRIGILTIREKWERRLGTTINSWKTSAYLSEKYPFHKQKDTVYLNGHVCPTQGLIEQIHRLKDGQLIYCGDRLIAWRSDQLLQDS